jgi:XRE family transcriptional regulator, regulator of sulfur utilization
VSASSEWLARDAHVAYSVVAARDAEGRTRRFPHTIASMTLLVRVALCALGLTLGLSSRAEGQVPFLRSTVFPKDSARSRNLASNQRSLVDTATALLSKLEIHESTLKPGQHSHPPHRHAHEEVIVLYQGDVDVLQGDVHRQAHGGDVIFLASNEWHNFTNIGTTNATYLVIRMDTHDQPKDLPPIPAP